ncbi:hypothetical protein [Nannocystis pusilla]|uniref:hypothetical protein n=1 Tax=Nannocystis pusilla TaxID=889268 RepID=UPI003B77B1FF
MSADAFLMVVDAARPSHADKSPRFLEVAHARGFVPLAWLALFEPDDLHVMPRRGARRRGGAARRLRGRFRGRARLSLGTSCEERDRADGERSSLQHPSVPAPS